MFELLAGYIFAVLFFSLVGLCEIICRRYLKWY